MQETQSDEREEALITSGKLPQKTQQKRDTGNNITTQEGQKETKDSSKTTSIKAIQPNSNKFSLLSEGWMGGSSEKPTNKQKRYPKGGSCLMLCMRVHTLTIVQNLEPLLPHPCKHRMQRCNNHNKKNMQRFRIMQPLAKKQKKNKLRKEQLTNISKELWQRIWVTKQVLVIKKILLRAIINLERKKREAA
ncbi:hypothetical protein H5410_003071 [Solanum commersonii]|uniref:Uncharacterized protein n=1 Tax=Solanum commersonii TaxID=4109 RepID=A0A9J6B439_SOLCO|nr:hypothetical protein H5410_003071 [Solanum commersonii]